MVDWGDIHKDFGKDSGWIITDTKQKLTWQQLWESWGFSIEEMKQLINTSLHPNEAYFGLWIKDKKQSNSLLNLDTENLRKEYNKIWTDIHQNFEYYQQLWEKQGLTYQDAQEWVPVGFKLNDYKEVKQWKNLNFTAQQAQSWIKKGLTPDDYNFASYLKQNNLTPEQYKNNSSQIWLNYRYPNKTQVEAISLEHLNFNQHSELIIDNYPNLKKITKDYYENIPNLTNLTINNCPQLKEIYIINSNLQQLNLNNLPKLKKLNCRDNELHQDLSFLSGLASLKRLDLWNNPFYGSLEYLKDMNKLEWLDITNTDIDSGLEYLPDSLEYFYCAARRENAKCKVIYNLFTGKDRNTFQKLKKLKKFGFAEKDLKQLVDNDLKLIPYEQFTNIEFLAQGGFGTIFKAKWKKNNSIQEVVLKSLNNSQDLKADFVQEVISNKLVDNNKSIVSCYGISQDPETKNCIMVMEYIKDGNLREYLDQNYKKSNLKSKLNQLHDVVSGLSEIHKKELTHRDFHSGNILNKKSQYGISFQCLITDLGLCKPFNENSDGKIFGVLPYVAPEVLQEKPYTQKADIYSFGIVAYELLANSYPYPKLDGLNLALKVCQGLRPNIDELKIPQLLKDLIKKCWGAEPEKRPNAEELKKIIWNWTNNKDAKFDRQYKAIEKEYNHFSKTTPYKINPGTITTSKMIDTKEITRKLQTSQEEFGSSEISMSSLLDSLPNISEETQQPEQQALQIQPTNQPYGTPGSSKNN